MRFPRGGQNWLRPASISLLRHITLVAVLAEKLVLKIWGQQWDLLSQLQTTQAVEESDKPDGTHTADRRLETHEDTQTCSYRQYSIRSIISIFTQRSDLIRLSII